MVEFVEDDLTPMRIDVFTLFPEWFDWFGAQRHVRNARRARLGAAASSTTATRPRSAAARSTTRPYGGGAGMVLRVDVVDAALSAAYGDGRAPGRVDPARALGAAARRRAGRRARRPSRTWRCSAAATRASTSGSASTSPTTRSRSARTCSPAASWPRWSSPTPCCASSPARSATPTARVEESFSEALGGAPEYPHYTRPASYRGWEVPEVLLSGDHARVREWRLERSRHAGRRRPEG